MIAAELENGICAAIDAALAEWAPGMRRVPVIRGYWRQAGNAVRGAELRATGVAIDVYVAPPSYERFELNKATFACEIEVTFKSASSAAAVRSVLPVCDGIERLLLGWQMDGGALSGDLGCDGLTPFALVATGGTAPSFNAAENTWGMKFTFSVTALRVEG